MKGKFILMLVACLVMGCISSEEGCAPNVWVDVSPDGKALLISSVKDDYAGVFWVSIDGKEVKRLADVGWLAELSPDSKQCAFMSWDAQEESPEKVELLLYDLASGTREILGSWSEKEPPYILPSWSPDGKEIAYAVWSLGTAEDETVPKTELHLVNLETRNNRLLSDDAGLFCSWSPDGKHLAFFESELGAIEWREGLVLGSLRMTHKQGTKGLAGVLFSAFADVAWLSNQQILFVTPELSLPCTERQKDDLEEAVFVYDMTTKTVAAMYQTRGAVSFASGLRLSPDRRRFLFGTQGPDDDEVTLWCYDFAISSRRKLAEKVKLYPFWVTNSRVGYFKSEDTIVIVDIDEKPKPVVKQTLDLDELLAPLRAAKEPSSPPPPQPAKEE